jgi:hypothetical protein
VSSASSLSTLLGSIQRLGLCQEGAPRSMDASHGHLLMGHPVTDRRWQCHAARYAPCGPRCGLSTTSALGHAMPGDASSLGSSFMCSLAIRYSSVNRHESCHDTCSESTRGRARCAVRALHASTGRVLWAGLPDLGLRRSRPVQCCGWATAGQTRVVHTGQARFRPSSRLKLEIPFSIFHSVSN